MERELRDFICKILDDEGAKVGNVFKDAEFRFCYGLMRSHQCVEALNLEAWRTRYQEIMMRNTKGFVHKEKELPDRIFALMQDYVGCGEHCLRTMASAVERKQMDDSLMMALEARENEGDAWGKIDEAMIHYERQMQAHMSNEDPKKLVQLCEDYSKRGSDREDLTDIIINLAAFGIATTETQPLDDTDTTQRRIHEIKGLMDLFVQVVHEIDTHLEGLLASIDKRLQRDGLTIRDFMEAMVDPAKREKLEGAGYANGLFDIPEGDIVGDVTKLSLLVALFNLLLRIFLILYAAWDDVTPVGKVVSGFFKFTAATLRPIGTLGRFLIGAVLSVLTYLIVGQWMLLLLGALSFVLMGWTGSWWFASVANSTKHHFLNAVMTVGTVWTTNRTLHAIGQIAQADLVPILTGDAGLTVMALFITGIRHLSWSEQPGPPTSARSVRQTITISNRISARSLAKSVWTTFNQIGGFFVFNTTFALTDFAFQWFWGQDLMSTLIAGSSPFATFLTLFSASMVFQLGYNTIRLGDIVNEEVRTRIIRYVGSRSIDDLGYGFLPSPTERRNKRPEDQSRFERALEVAIPLWKAFTKFLGFIFIRPLQYVLGTDAVLEDLVTSLALWLKSDDPLRPGGKYAGPWNKFMKGILFSTSAATSIMSMFTVAAYLPRYAIECASSYGYAVNRPVALTSAYIVYEGCEYLRKLLFELTPLSMGGATSIGYLGIRVSAFFFLKKQNKQTMGVRFLPFWRSWVRNTNR